eukprot:scaffold21854_cov68-Phaeocystis_antarctica.AAC.1
MEVTLVGASWDVVAGDQTGVDFIPMKFFCLRLKFCGVPSRLALGVGALSGFFKKENLQNTIEYANGTRQTIQLWDQFRIWDPGD